VSMRDRLQRLEKQTGLDKGRPVLIVTQTTRGKSCALWDRPAPVTR
jgi:hypothetical protein